MKKSILVMKSLVLVGALFLVGCNDDDGIKCPEALTGELTASETAFSGKWVFSAMVANDAIDLTDDDTKNPSTDIFAQYSACDRDLIYDFMENRDYSFKQGSLAVDCKTTPTLKGTWGLTGSALTFVASCASQKVNIELNEASDEFTYESTVNFRDIDGAPKTTKVVFTYKKMAVEQPV